MRKSPRRVCVVATRRPTCSQTNVFVVMFMNVWAAQCELGPASDQLS
jgi:hypothetical protein